MKNPQRFSITPKKKVLADLYQQEGYLVLENFYTPEECQRLMQRMKELVEGCDLDELGAVFCAEESGHMNTGRNQYFRESGDKIRFFWRKESGLIKPPDLKN